MNRSEFRAIAKEHGEEVAKAVEAESDFLKQTHKALITLTKRNFIKQFEIAVKRACTQNAEYKFYLPYKFKFTGKVVKYFLPSLYIKKVIRKINVRTVFLQNIRMTVAGRFR